MSQVRDSLGMELDEATRRAGQLIAEALTLLITADRPTTSPHPTTPGRSDAAPDHLYLDTAEVSARLGVPAPSLRSWRSAGTGPVAVKFGGRVVYPVDELEQWEREQRAAAAAEHKRRGSGYLHDRTNRQQKL